MSTQSVQSLVAPPVPSAKAMEYSAAKVEDPRETVTLPNNKKTDFRTLISNSMDEVMKERKAKENGDFSNAKTDKEFLEKLAEQTKDKKAPKNELGKDDFLKLFVTQLQNQNPLNPEADTEMAAKLAQFNGLEQMLNLNKAMDKLLTEQSSTRNVQMVNYVGRDITVDGGRVKIEKGKPTPTEYKLENDATQSTLEIRNSSGVMVHQIELGPSMAGTHQLKWDGKTSDGKAIPDGTYTLAISARNMDGQSLPVAMTSRVRVTGIDVNAKEGHLYSDMGRIKLDQIKSVGLPGFDNQMADMIALPPTADPAAAAADPTVQAQNALDQALVADKNAAVAASLAPAKNTKAPQTNPPAASEALDRLKAEGKLDLAKAKEQTPNNEVKASSKKGIDPKSGPSAKMDKPMMPQQPSALTPPTEATNGRSEVRS